MERRGFLQGWMCFLFPFLALVTPKEDLLKNWRLSPTKESLHHHLEGLEDKGKEWNLKIWYEDATVLKEQKASPDLLCKLAHTLIFGRHRLRQKSEVPLKQAFASFSNLEAVTLTFFTVIYKNKPHPAPKEPDPKTLRVIWRRNEIIVPYLALTITREEWKSMSQLLKNSENISLKAFHGSLCASVLQLTTTLRSNFLELKKIIEMEKG